MEEYQTLIEDTLLNGNVKENRTDLGTISQFGYTYDISLDDETLPIVTTKKFYWDSFLSEFIWYLSGEEHIRTLREQTGIWDEWADEKGRLDTSYARFWRRFPLAEHEAEGEVWAGKNSKWVNDGEETFDQIRYISDMLQEKPQSRRIVLNAWHPANASVSTLPPCHFTAVFNVQGDDTLNCHLTQRSGDIALGIPFNIAGYSLLTKLFAEQAGYDVGTFSHTIVDAHIYCGRSERQTWYQNNMAKLREKLAAQSSTTVKTWIEQNAPGGNSDNEDHVPNLLEVLSREPFEPPKVTLPETINFNSLSKEDISLENYKDHGSLSFDVAE